jgi:23S rRNA pseudouridine2605 synthase
MDRGSEWIEVTIDEGRNRQVRRVLEALGYRVVRLIRTAVGSVQLGALAQGETRMLSGAEKSLLDGGGKY